MQNKSATMPHVAREGLYDNYDNSANTSAIELVEIIVYTKQRQQHAKTLIVNDKHCLDPFTQQSAIYRVRYRNFRHYHTS